MSLIVHIQCILETFYSMYLCPLYVSREIYPDFIGVPRETGV